MPSLLIAVHGMGSFPPGWSADVRKKLETSAVQYAAFRGAPLFDDDLQFAEVGYDKISSDYVTQWNASRSGLETFLTQQNKKLATPWKPDALYTFIDDTTLPADVTSAFWSTLIDPILYRGTPLVRDDVRTLLTQQIYGAINAATQKAQGAAVDVSILAHSLGTAVVHDVLQQVASGVAGGNASFATAKFQFKNLFMVADVARLGPPDLIDLRVDKGGYLVRPVDPRPGSTPKGSYYTLAFYSFRHEWDPFVRWAPMTPSRFGQDWGANFHDVQVSHVHQFNVHSATHYLDHPDVHVPILNALAGFTAISTKEQLDAVAQYPQFLNAACTAQINQLRGLVESFPGTANDDLAAIGIYGARFFGAVKAAANACGSIPSGL